MPRASRAALLAACLPLICLLILAGAALSAADDARADDAPQLSGLILTSDGNALGGITVLLYQEPAIFLRATTSLAESGYFSFTGLVAGTHYRVVFSDDAGLFLPTAWNGKADVNAADSIAFEGIPIVLQPVHMTAAARIGGRVTDEADNGLGNVIVTLYAPDVDTSGAWRPLRTLESDATGHFRFVALPAGVYRVGFVYNPTQPLFAPAFFPTPARTLADAEDILVNLGDFRDNLHVALARTATITGTVAGIDTAAPGHVYACLRTHGALPPPSGLWSSGSDCMASKLVDADGSFALIGLEAGDYNVVFFDMQWPPAYFDAPYIDPVQGLQNATGSHPPSLITLGTGETRAHVDVTLRRAGHIAGTACALDGTQLGNLDVRLYRLQDGVWHWLHSARTDARTDPELLGRFSFQTVISSTYTVAFVDPLGRYAPTYHPGVPTLNNATAFLAEVGASRPHVDAYLPAAGSVAGRVVAAQSGAAQNGAAQLPLAGVEVSLYLRGNEWMAQTLTDGAGRYTLAGLGAEAYMLRVRDPAGHFAPATTALFTLASLYAEGGEGGAAAVPDIALTTATLAETAVITPTGHVHSTTGTAIAGATVSLYKLPGWRARVAAWEAEPFTCASAASVGAPVAWREPAPDSGAFFAVPTAEGIEPPINPQRTDAQGAFGWKLPPGCWFVRVQADGYDAAASAVAGAPPVIDNLDIVLQPLPATATPVSLPTHTATATQPALPTVKATQTAPPATPVKTPAGTITPATQPTPAPATATPVAPIPTATTSTTPRPPFPGALDYRVLLPAVVR